MDQPRLVATPASPSRLKPRLAAMTRVTARVRPGRLPLALGVLCLAVSFAQRPGLIVTDSRIDLSVNPALFLSRLTSVFSGTGDLGHLQGGQFVGYLMPMAPWYAFAHAIGLSTWVAERLWLAGLLFVAGYGMVGLLDALLGPRRRTPHAVGAVLYALNPFVIVFVSRATVTLLAATILPWLMLAVWRGIREPRSWRWPAVIGLLGALSGGGVNAAALAWIAVAPLALLVWEAKAGKAGRGAALSFTWRAAACALGGSAWWLIPVSLQGRYGASFLSFTEQPQTIWATTSMSESLRLLGYWPMYLSTGYGAATPVMRIGQTYLFDPIVIVGSFMVPAFALLGLRATRRWFYAPLFGLLACVSLVAMTAGFPSGTAFGSTINWLYEHVATVRFLRTSYKAAPVLALCLAVLGAVAAGELVTAVRRHAARGPNAPTAWLAGQFDDAGIARRIERLGRYATLPALGAVVLACAPVAWALPLFTGHAIDRPLAYGHVPPAWPAAVADAGRAAGQNRRTMILPGELFGNYRWGNTWDSVAPALGRAPVIIRQATQYADPRAAQLLDEVDDTVQQARLVPGELAPLLRVMGVGQVLVPTDALDDQSGGLDPVGVSQELAAQPGFAHPQATYGKVRGFIPSVGRDGPELQTAQLRRYAVSGGPGIVHVDSAGPATIAEGGPGALIQLAAAGQLQSGNPLLYAEDLKPGRLADLVRSGARLVFTDSNRRRVIAATYVRQDVGPTLTATAPIPTSAASWNPFPAAGSTAQTVANYGGLSSLVAPQPAGSQLFPAFRPAAALDGNLGTAWLPDPSLPDSQRWMELHLAKPTKIDSIGIIPRSVDGFSPLWVAISVNGGPEREVRLPVQKLPTNVVIGAARVSTLRFRVTRVTGSQLFLGAGGLSEIHIPGVTPKTGIPESLSLPTLLAFDTRRLNTSHSEIVVAVTRDSADFPTRAGNDQGLPLARSEIGATDPESGLNRTVSLPAARTFTVDGWASVAPGARDDAIDALAGPSHGWSIRSSSRFEGVPASRGSSALDGNPSTSWVSDVYPSLTIDFGQDAGALPLAAAGELINGLPGVHRPVWRGALQAPQPFLKIQAPKPVLLSSLQLVAGPRRYASPATVQISTDGGESPVLTVARDGTVDLGRSVLTRHLIIRILSVHPPTGKPGARLLRAVAISEIVSPLHPPPPRRTGSLTTPCGTLYAIGPEGKIPMRAVGTVQALDRGSPLRIEGCGPVPFLSLPAGRSTILAPAGTVLRPDQLVLDSPAPAPLPSQPAGTASVAGGLSATGVPQGATVRTAGPGWLVLGESYSPGWRAACRGRNGLEHGLGAPTPIDGFANGWPITAGCTHATFTFAPQQTADAGYIVSLVALPVLVALLWFPRRRRRTAVPAAPPPDRPGDVFYKPSWLTAISIGTASTIVIGFLFGLPLGPLAMPIVWRGTSPRRLFTLGGLLLLVVPVAYLIRAATNVGGYDFGFAYDNLVGHWIAVSGVCCIAGGCLLQLLAARGPLPIDPLRPQGARPRPASPEPEPVEEMSASL
jgi:arabinofuranan 3-O-arabinosyltransferase